MTVVIVSGTRLATAEHWRAVEEGLALACGGLVHATLRHGAAKGVDELAASIVDLWGWDLDPQPAEWQRCDPDIPKELGGCPPRPHLKAGRGGSYCPLAGPRRNQQKLIDREPRAELAVCFPAVGSRGRSGTWDLAYRAADAGIHVEIFPLRIDASAAPLLPASVEEVTP